MSTSTKRIDGRIGEPTEFVEFVVGPKHSIIAQKGAAGFWFVFESRRRSVRTLDCYRHKENAERKAREIAELRRKP